MKAFNLSIFLLCFLLQACTVAPFSNHYSARTIGKNKFAVSSGFEGGSDQILFMRAGFGLTDKVDIGIIAERQFFDDVFGGWARVGLVNQKEGFNMSLEGGAGGSNLSSYAYAGSAIGYKLKWWEPYFIARYNYVNYDNEIIFDLDWMGAYCVRNQGDFHYGSFTLGQTLWLKEWLGLNLNVNCTHMELEDLFWGAGVVLTF